MTAFKVTVVVWRDPNDATLGIVQNHSSRGIFTKGQYLHHKDLARFKAGDFINVSCSYESGIFSVASIYPSKQTYDVVSPKTGSRLEIVDEVRVTGMAEAADNAVKVAVAQATSPSPLSGYFISDDLRLAFTTLHKISNANPEQSAKLVILGPSGYGKTTIPQLFAKQTGRGYYDMNCGSVRDPEEWYGYREAKDNSTVFIESEFIKAVQQDNMVIVLNELNRVEPWLHNALYPLLDDTHGSTVHGQTFKVGKGVIFVATMNTGHKHTGIFEADAALINRFQFVVEVGPMPKAQESKVLTVRTGITLTQAEQLVNIATVLRDADIDCSTRDTLAIATMMGGGADLRSAIEFALIRRIPQDVGGGLRKKAMDLVNANLTPYRALVPADDVFGFTVPTTTKKEEEKERTFIFSLNKGKESSFNRLAAMKVVRDYFNPAMDVATLITALQNGETITLTAAMSNENVVHLAKLLKNNHITMHIQKEA